MSTSEIVPPRQCHLPDFKNPPSMHLDHAEVFVGSGTWPSISNNHPLSHFVVNKSGFLLPEIMGMGGIFLNMRKINISILAHNIAIAILY